MVICFRIAIRDVYKVMISRGDTSSRWFEGVLRRCSPGQRETNEIRNDQRHVHGGGAIFF